MKIAKIISLILSGILLLAFTAKSQTYKLDVSNESYQSLNDSTIVTQDDYDIDTAYQIILPFDCKVMDRTSNSIWVTSTGSVGIGDDFDSEDFLAINVFHIQLQSFLVDATISPILYSISGDEGQRIAKIEWKMAYFRALEGLFDNINMQVWLYEEDNKIELRYGPSTLELITHQYEVEDSIGHFGGIVGIAHNTNLTFEGTNLTGDSTMPTITNIIENDLSSNGAFRLGFPEDGTVYALTKVTTKIDVVSAEFNLNAQYLSNDQNLLIENFSEGKSIKYQLLNQYGQIVEYGQMTDPIKILSVSTLVSGIYILHVENEDGSFKNWKFNIQN